jgi:hypothetical protein
MIIYHIVWDEVNRQAEGGRNFGSRMYRNDERDGIANLGTNEPESILDIHNQT